MFSDVNVIKTFAGGDDVKIGDTDLVMPKIFAARLAVGDLRVVIGGDCDGSDTFITHVELDSNAHIVQRTLQTLPLPVIVNEALKAMVTGYVPQTLEHPYRFGDKEFQRIRDIYWHAHVTYGPTRSEVQRTWQISEKTAARWVQAARKEYSFPLGKDKAKNG